MPEYLNCMICASGPIQTIARIQSLIDEHTRPGDDGDELTYFNELTLYASGKIGFRWRQLEGKPEDNVLWAGQLSFYPGTVAQELSVRFPDVTIEVKFTYDNDDYAEEEGIRVLEYKVGKERLTYHCYEFYEFDGTDTEPIEHWRGDLFITDKAQSQKVMEALVRDGIIEIYDDEYMSDRRSDDVLAWVGERFPDVKVEIAYWRPYHLEDTETHRKHFIGIDSDFPDRTQQVKTYRF